MPETSDWLSWERYETTLISVLRQFAHFIVDYELAPSIGTASVLWRGRLRCEDGFEVAVDQRQDVRRLHGRIQVRTARYSYQVLVRRPSVVELIRYDNFHVHPGHADGHHVHRNGRVEHVGATHSPRLIEVLAEAESIWRSLR